MEGALLIFLAAAHLLRYKFPALRAASGTSSKTSSKTTSKASVKSALETACEGLKGNARKIMQVISEDPGITIESLATLVKLTPYGIRYHLAGLAKSVGLRHSNDRKGGEWNVSGAVKPLPNATQETAQETAQENLSDEELEILACINDDATVTRKELSGKIGISADSVKRRLDVLKKKLALQCSVSGQGAIQMKMRRFNSTGVEMTRQYLSAIKTECIGDDILDYLNTKYKSELAAYYAYRPVVEC